MTEQMIERMAEAIRDVQGGLNYDYMDFCRDAARAALTAANVADWQPIETAPKDGTAFDAWIPDAFGGHRMCDLSFNWRGKLRQHGLLTEAEMPRWPTHWRPLPDPPALAGQS